MMFLRPARIFFDISLGRNPYELPIEFTCRYDHLWNYRGTWPWGVRSRPGSVVHGECRAVAYRVFTQDSTSSPLDYAGNDSGIKLAVVIAR